MALTIPELGLLPVKHVTAQFRFRTVVIRTAVALFSHRCRIALLAFALLTFALLSLRTVDPFALLAFALLASHWCRSHFCLSQRGQPGPEVLSECNLPTLAWRRRVHCLCLLYILYKGQGPPSLSELLPATVQARTEIVLRSSHSFRFPFASSSRHLSSFLCFSIRLWNTLRPLPYLRVAVFLPSGLFFTLSAKQIIL